MSWRGTVYPFSGKVQCGVMVRSIALLLCLAIAAVGAGAQDPEPRPLAQAVDSLTRLDSVIRDSRPKLDGLLFGPAIVNFSCTSPSPDFNLPNEIPFKVDYGIPALKPRLGKLLDEQKQFSDKFMPPFQHHLRLWSRTVSQVSQDLDEISRQTAALQKVAADGNKGEARQRDIIHSIHRAQHDLRRSSHELSKITRDVAVYGQRQQPLLADFVELRAELDSNYTKLYERASFKTGGNECRPVGDLPYVNFTRDVHSSIETLRAVYDDASSSIEDARFSTGVLLGETTTMSSDIDLVAMKLNTAHDLAATNAALLPFHVDIAVNAWKNLAAHAATDIQ